MPRELNAKVRGYAFTPNDTVYRKINMDDGFKFEKVDLETRVCIPKKGMPTLVLHSGDTSQRLEEIVNSKYYMQGNDGGTYPAAYAEYSLHLMLPLEHNGALLDCGRIGVSEKQEVDVQVLTDDEKAMFVQVPPGEYEISKIYRGRLEIYITVPGWKVNEDFIPQNLGDCSNWKWALRHASRSEPSHIERAIPSYETHQKATKILEDAFKQLRELGCGVLMNEGARLRIVNDMAIVGPNTDGRQPHKIPDVAIPTITFKNLDFGFKDIA